jgi:hypothetical protein
VLSTCCEPSSCSSPRERSGASATTEHCGRLSISLDRRLSARRFGKLLSADGPLRRLAALPSSSRRSKSGPEWSPKVNLLFKLAFPGSLDRRSYHRHQPKSSDTFTRRPRTTRSDDKTTAKALAKKTTNTTKAKASANQSTITKPRHWQKIPPSPKPRHRQISPPTQLKPMHRQTSPPTIKAKAPANKSTNLNTDDDYDYTTTQYPSSTTTTTTRLQKANYEGKWW